MARIKFVTDSGADLPADLRQEFDIQVMPFPIAFPDREIRDGVELTAEEFYKALIQSPTIPTHAQLTPFQFEECYEQAYQNGYTHLIYTAINAKASATFCNALQARESFYEEHPDAREKMGISVIDSGTYTLAYGWSVVQGAKLAAKGASPEEVVACIKDWIAHSRILFVPLDLRFAKKSGRVSAVAAFMGEALGLKPILTFENGESKLLSKVRGEKNVIPAMLELCRKNRKKNSPYILLRTDNPEMSGRLQGACIQEFGQPPELECCVGGVITTNAGPNAIGLLYREK